MLKYVSRDMPIWGSVFHLMSAISRPQTPHSPRQGRIPIIHCAVGRGIWSLVGIQRSSQVSNVNLVISSLWEHSNSSVHVLVGWSSCLFYLFRLTSPSATPTMDQKVIWDAMLRRIGEWRSVEWRSVSDVVLNDVVLNDVVLSDAVLSSEDLPTARDLKLSEVQRVSD